MDTEVVGTFRLRHEAEFAQQVLDANDIQAIIIADDAVGQIMNAVRLVVRAEDAQRAREVLGEHEVS